MPGKLISGAVLYKAICYRTFIFICGNDMQTCTDNGRNVSTFAALSEAQRLSLLSSYHPVMILFELSVVILAFILSASLA